MALYNAHPVKPGDTMASIAVKYGMHPNSVWDDPKNRQLKDRRKDPNVLLPGDVVYVREKEVKEEPCASEKRHCFKRMGVPKMLRIQFKLDEKLQASTPYVLMIDGKRTEGKIDAQGKIEMPVPLTATEGTISFPDTGEEYHLELGFLAPITETYGVQKRLQILGYYDGPLDDRMSWELQQAIRDFQKANNLEDTGEINDDLRRLIQETYRG